MQNNSNEKYKKNKTGKLGKCISGFFVSWFVM